MCVVYTLLFATHTRTLQVAREVVWQKFSKLPQLAKVLLGTGDRIIAEATRNDRIWGACENVAYILRRFILTTHHAAKTGSGQI